MYEPAEYAAYLAAQKAAQDAGHEAGAKAEAEARARGESEYRATLARDAASNEITQALLASAPTPKPLRHEEHEECIDGAEHEPVIWAHDRRLVQPVPAVVKTLVERSTYGSLRGKLTGGVEFRPSAHRRRRRASMYSWASSPAASSRGAPAGRASPATSGGE